MAFKNIIIADGKGLGTRIIRLFVVKIADRATRWLQRLLLVIKLLQRTA